MDTPGIVHSEKAPVRQLAFFSNAEAEDDGSGIHSQWTRSQESMGLTEESDKISSQSRDDLRQSMERAAKGMNLTLGAKSMRMVVDKAMESISTGSSRTGIEVDGSDTLVSSLGHFTSNEQTYERISTGWKNQKKFVCWLVVYYMISLVIFILKITSLLTNEAAVAVFGPCVAFTRAAALLIDLNAALVLMPVSRHFMTRLQSSRRLRNLIVFDAAIDGHILFGGAILIAGFAHSLLHCFTYHSFVNADPDDIEAFFGPAIASVVPASRSDRMWFLLKQRATYTGIAIWICMIAGFSVLRSRRKNFNRFWYFHHLLLVMLFLLCVHGTGNLIEKFQTAYWLLIPLCAYCIPRIYREISSRTVKFLSFQVCGDLIELSVEKPPSWRLSLTSGMYAMINIPAISRFEWHPFTMSSAPQEDHLTFHISCTGDWTKALKQHLVQSSKTSFGILDIPIKIEGPFGAPCQSARDFQSVVLIGAGVGVTPMISTLKGLLGKPGRVRKVYFYWTTRDRCSFKLYSHQMDRIFDMETDLDLVIRHFLTTVKEVNEDDEDTMIFQNAINEIHAKTHIDVRLGHKTNQPIGMGRPNWNTELMNVIEEAWERGIENTGVFLCGGQRMAVQIQSTCTELSRSHKGHLFFSKEIF